MSEIIIEAHGHYEVWTFNGEARRNALSVAFMKAFDANVARVSGRDRTVRAVVMSFAAR